MFWIELFRKLGIKKFGLTLGLCLGYLLILITSACIDSEDSEYLEGCPRPKEADATGIKQVFFSPYKQQRYASASDTVNFSEFRFNFELEIKVKENQNSGSLPGQAFALSCIQIYNVRNISNITVILTAPFAGLPIGTDISYLLITPEEKPLSQLRQFENISVYFGSRLNLTPPNYSQLKTRTFLFLKNGTQTFVDSTSPFLKTN
ncbi:hypothetical protein [Algoriphagus sp.]|uniref:hypothetical protein n=1 Tax=Algoriphagus sp. TaxID=1872435 RepID=UPI003919A37C